MTTAAESLRRDRAALINALEAAGAKIVGNRVQCPFHKDNNPSASIYDADGVPKFKCHGCGFSGDVFDVIQKRDSCDFKTALECAGVVNNGAASKPNDAGRSRPTTYTTFEDALSAALVPIQREHPDVAYRAYPYGDDWRRVRFDWPGGKTFREISRNGNGWLLRKPKGKTQLYRIDEVTPGSTVHVVEGEKAVDAGWAIGLQCVTSGGSSAAGSANWTPLAGLSCVVQPDYDEPGERGAQTTVAKLLALSPPAEVRVLRLPGLPEGGDLFDFIEARDSRDNLDLRLMVEALAEEVQPETPRTETTATDAQTIDDAAFDPSLNLTDTDNATRLINRHENDLRYTHGQGYLVWADSCFAKDTEGHTSWLARQTIKSLYAELTSIEDLEVRKKRFAALVRCEAHNRIRGMLELAKCDPRIRVATEDLDRDPWLFNCLNGTLELRTGKLREHRRSDLITKLAPVQYDPKAKCKRWLKFLERIMERNTGLIEFLHRWCGHCLSGDITEQVIVILHGQGANGKNVFLDTIRGVMGDYASKASPDLLTIRRSEEHPTEIAGLAGKRLVVASETEEGKRLRVEFVKQSTGDESLCGRFMRQDYFEFARTHKTMLATNAKPTIRDDSLAIWRRIKLVPFSVSIPEAEQDRQLTQTLRAEWPGILAWMVRGCLAWQSKGLPAVEEIRAATEEYRSEQDVLGPFIDECCTTGPECRASRKAIWSKYSTWAAVNGGKNPLTRLELYERLRRRGYSDGVWREANRTIRGFEGIGVLTS